MPPTRTSVAATSAFLQERLEAHRARKVSQSDAGGPTQAQSSPVEQVKPEEDMSDARQRSNSDPTQDKKATDPTIKSKQAVETSKERKRGVSGSSSAQYRCPREMGIKETSAVSILRIARLSTLY